MSDVFSSIYTAQSGLTAFSHGLRTVSSNVSNMNTIGYRGFQAQFTNLTSRDGGPSSDSGGATTGGGVAALADTLSLRPGSAQATGEATDVAIDGPGFFLVRQPGGELRITRNGHFTLKDHQLVTAQGDKVQAFVDGETQDFDISQLLVSTGEKSTKVTMDTGGALVLDKGPYTAPTFSVFDASGARHTLSVRFEQVEAADPGTGTGTPGSKPNEWNVTVKEGDAELAGSPFRLRFDILGSIEAGSREQKITLRPTGQDPMEITLDFDGLVSNQGNATDSEMKLQADGHALGQLVDGSISIDETGTVQLSYTNGEKASGPQLALATVADPTQLVQLENAQFRVANPDTLRFGVAGTGFGTIASEQLEGSNVELSEEFSQLILHQRGYQAASELISTANSMIESLLRMRSGG
jgi:flagellar hook protein FlgE